MGEAVGRVELSYLQAPGRPGLVSDYKHFEAFEEGTPRLEVVGVLAIFVGDPDILTLEHPRAGP